MIVVTDGRTDDEVEFPSTGARHQGITTFAVGIGTGVNRQTLDTITRDPDKVLLVTNTGNSKLDAMNSLVRWLCRGTSVFNSAFSSLEKRLVLTNCGFFTSGKKM